MEFGWIKPGVKFKLKGKNGEMLKRNLTVSQEPSFLYDTWVTFAPEVNGFIYCERMEEEDGLA